MHKLRVMRQRRYAHSLDLYERVLAGFIANPHDVANLPHGPARKLVRSRLRSA